MQGPQLYPLSSVNVIPTTQPQGIYYALRYLYEDDKDVNAWYRSEKNYKTSVKDLIERAWQSVPKYNSSADY